MNGVSVEELNTAIAQIRTEELFTRDGAFNVAASINEAIARGDWRAYTTILPNIQNVTAERVKRAVIKYFEEDKCTIGYFIPKKGNDKVDDKNSDKSK